MSQLANSEKVGIRQRVSGVINRLVRRTFLNYAALVAVVGVVTFLVMHYYTDLFKNEETGNKRIIHQAIAAGGVAVVAAVAAFFARLL